MVHTCGNVLWSCISIRAHDSRCHMGSLPCRSILCKTKVRELCIQVLLISNQRISQSFCACSRDPAGRLSKRDHTESRRMLEVLKSLYITCFSAACRNASPRAAPMAIFILRSHESGSPPSANHIHTFRYNNVTNRVSQLFQR